MLTFCERVVLLPSLNMLVQLFSSISAKVRTAKACLLLHFASVVIQLELRFETFHCWLKLDFVGYHVPYCDPDLPNGRIHKRSMCDNFKKAFCDQFM